TPPTQASVSESSQLAGVCDWPCYELQTNNSHRWPVNSTRLYSNHWPHIYETKAVVSAAQKRSSYRATGKRAILTN
ncbi:hypothetical protein, partial [Oceanisphaera sp. W20_SRM_FM3]|uniref:hypothetical protein n=1 Tax=Oceanisphaera sp. W20_SRM_FM3 TaxID=3240267 RepID=UPI003F99D7BD